MLGPCYRDAMLIPFGKSDTILKVSLELRVVLAIPASTRALVLNHCSELAICINASLGFVVYCVVSIEFRRELAKLVRRCPSRGGAGAGVDTGARDSSTQVATARTRSSSPTGSSKSVCGWCRCSARFWKGRAEDTV